MPPLSQVGDFILHSGGDLLQPIAELHLLGRGVLLQRRDDLKKDGKTLEHLFLKHRFSLGSFKSCSVTSHKEMTAITLLNIT